MTHPGHLHDIQEGEICGVMEWGQVDRSVAGTEAAKPTHEREGMKGSVCEVQGLD